MAPGLSMVKVRSMLAGTTYTGCLIVMLVLPIHSIGDLL